MVDTWETIQKIAADGRGTLTITSLELGNLVPGLRADIEKMGFRVVLVFRKEESDY